MMHPARWARNAVIAQCSSLLMQVFAKKAFATATCDAMDKHGKEPAYSAAFVI
jgi:hypothetical protein